MDFLPPCTVPCEICRGACYNSRTPQVRYKGKNIAEVLNMDMEEAAEFFASQPRLDDPLRLLVQVLRRLVEMGNTVVVIEHNLELICEADYIIDVGPGAGAAGGTITAQGTVRQLSRAKSPTAPFIKAELER